VVVHSVSVEESQQMGHLTESSSSTWAGEVGGATGVVGRAVEASALVQVRARWTVPTQRRTVSGSQPRCCCRRDGRPRGRIGSMGPRERRGCGRGGGGGSGGGGGKGSRPSSGGGSADSGMAVTDGWDAERGASGEAGEMEGAGPAEVLVTGDQGASWGAFPVNRCSVSRVQPLRIHTGASGGTG
jgi:hypothetical protein